MPINPNLINKLRFKGGVSGRWQRRIMEVLSKHPVGMTAKDLRKQVPYNTDLIVRSCRSLVKRGILFQRKAREFNSKAHGQQLVYFLDD
jgi:hypothetical protein